MCVLLNWSKLTVKTLLIRNIIDEQDAHGATVISGGNGTETLLTSGIPDLKLDALAIELDSTNLEVNANGGDERGRKRVFAESQQAARFAYTGVADQEEFDLCGAEG